MDTLGAADLLHAAYAFADRRRRLLVVSLLLIQEFRTPIERVTTRRSIFVRLSSSKVGGHPRGNVAPRAEFRNSTDTLERTDGVGRLDLMKKCLRYEIPQSHVRANGKGKRRVNHAPSSLLRRSDSSDASIDTGTEHHGRNEPGMSWEYREASASPAERVKVFPWH